jgi:hypothetical protein
MSKTCKECDMTAKVLVQARIDRDIKENFTEKGNWLFDEQERKFVKKQIVKEFEESQGYYIVKNNKESMQSFLKRAMKVG